MLAAGEGNDSPQRVQRTGDTRRQGREGQLLATTENKGPGKRRNLRRTQQARAQRRVWAPSPLEADAEGRKTPVVVGEGATHRTAQGSANVGVGGAEAGRLRVRRHCAARVRRRSGADRKRLVRRGTYRLRSKEFQRSSRHSVVPVAAPRSLTLAEKFQQPRKSAGLRTERWCKQGWLRSCRGRPQGRFSESQ